MPSQGTRLVSFEDEVKSVQETLDDLKKIDTQLTNSPSVVCKHFFPTRSFYAS